MPPVGERLSATALPDTPLYAQYRALKQRAPGALLLFRLGDFYELFGEDARVGAEVLGLALTSRDGTTPMAGVPVAALDGALSGLVAAGHRVAVAEQMEPAAPGRALVRRDIVRTASPGTLVDEQAAEAGERRFLCCVASDDEGLSVAAADVLSGEFRALLFDGPDAAERALEAVLALDPAELLIGPGAATELLAAPLRARLGDSRLANLDGLDPFHAAPPPSGGATPSVPAAAAALEAYLRLTQGDLLPPLRPLDSGLPKGTMPLTPEARRQLGIGPEPGRPTLWSVVGRCRTAMGRRLLRRWLESPLTQVTPILARQAAVAAFVASPDLAEALAALLRDLPDLERIAARSAQSSATPRELASLGRGLAVLPKLGRLLADAPPGPLRGLASGLAGPPGLGGRIVALLADGPPAVLSEGGVVRDGADAEVDRLRDLVRGGRALLAGMEQAERQRTGLRSLKVGYHRRLGYYFELPRGRHEHLPEEYRVLQGLAQAVRYTTPDLERKSREVERAQADLLAREAELFFALRREVAAALDDLRRASEGVAELDARLSLAEVARLGQWVRPEVTAARGIEVVAGRHPVLDRTLPPGVFVPNDLRLGDDADLAVVTGPNMAGKSTYLRQAALLCVLAQIGAFVPAERARIGVVDRIFTRIGSGDDLVAGDSTFMLEMREVAHILRHATRRSLVVIDELGRGTATYDGLAIAWAVVEHLEGRLRPLTLLATHYHELIELAERLPRAKNLSVQVVEAGGEVRFLHRVMPGGADRSYGVAVARLAGLPPGVLRRASALLEALEARDRPPPLPEAPPPPGPRQALLSADLDAPLRRELLAQDPSRLTPLDALVWLTAMRERVLRGDLMGPAAP
jgi:DNA mismatch repair protein MutS